VRSAFRRGQAVGRAAQDMRGFGHQVGTIQRDISSPDDAQDMAREALDRFGPFDILVNNVGSRVLDVPTEELS
jgi:NAD(P)-dependent dehydrogenase (short-subunit alcohol dehydrogenase family)